MRIRRLRLIHTPTLDWEVVRAFYRDLLDLPESGGWGFPGDRGAFLAAGAGEIELMERDAAALDLLPGARPGWHLALEVDDLDAAHARLLAAGVPVLRGLRSHPWGSRDFVVSDPAGNLILLFANSV